MTRSIVLTNHKGGVGKSTSATNIALGLVHVLRRIKTNNCCILLVDTDSQEYTFLVTTGQNDSSTDNNLYTVLIEDCKKATNVLAECIVQSEGML